MRTGGDTIAYKQTRCIPTTTTTYSRCTETAFSGAFMRPKHRLGSLRKRHCAATFLFCEARMSNRTALLLQVLRTVNFMMECFNHGTTKIVRRRLCGLFHKRFPIFYGFSYPSFRSCPCHLFFLFEILVLGKHKACNRFFHGRMCFLNVVPCSFFFLSLLSLSG